MSTSSPPSSTPALGKRPVDTRVYISQMIFPRDTNELGMATAGVILKAIDITASLSAGKLTGQLNVTASLDQLDFINPVKLWELFTAEAKVTRTWNTSMEVEVALKAENIRTGRTHQVARGYLVFVSIDEKTDKPVAVTPLILSTPEDEAQALAADARKASRQLEKSQLVPASQTAIDAEDRPFWVARTMTPDDANIHFHVFGGMILEMIHQAAEKAATAQANGPVISVRQDRMSFEQPAYIGEEVKAMAVITRTWTTSMEIQVDVLARDHKTQETRKVASSYHVFIAQDQHGNPSPVPLYTPQTPRQQLRWEQAQIRRENRTPA